MKKLKILLQSNYLYIILLIITSIYCFIILKFDIHITNYNVNSNSFTGVITDIKKKDNYNILEVKNKEKIIVYDYNKIDNYKVGYLINITGKFQEPNSNTNFYLFNYNHYLKSKKIYWSVTAENIKIISKNMNFLYKIKNVFIDKIQKINNPYIYAFIMGDSSKIEENVINSYQANGISHLFAVSGLHVGLISIVLIKVLNWVKKSHFNYILVFLVLIFYIFLTNYAKSVIRASLFYILLTFAKIFKLQISNIKVFLLVIIVSLIANPFNLYNTAFLFSYVITLFLIIFSNIINRENNYFKKIFATSFIAFLAGLPILINSYFNINLISFILNIFFVPFVSFIIFPLSLLTFIIPVFNNILNIFLFILENLSLLMQKVKIFNLTMHHLNVIGIIVYYLVIIVTLIGINNRKYHSLLLLIIVLLTHNNYRYLDPNAYLIMLDVNQGDSILLILPNNKGNILIDTGGIYGKNLTTNTLIPVLKSNGIKKLDYLILTHGDYDHLGEAINLVNRFKVDKVIFNNDDYNDLESQLVEVLDNKKIQYYKGLKKLNIDKYQLYFLNTKKYDNENDNSNVIYLNFNNYQFLFMGDAGIEKEKDILDSYNLRNIDFLKVGHHGSNTSSSKYFINSINPKYSLISVGKNNGYGHPKDEVLENLSNSKIYRTDIDGSIKIKLNNKGYKIRTCAS